MTRGRLLLLLLCLVSLPAVAFGLNRKQCVVDSNSFLVSKTAICPEVLSLNLDGTQETPPTGSTAVGACVGLIAADRTNLTVTCAQNVVDANAAHIHLAPVGVAGPIVCPAQTVGPRLTISCALDSTLRTALEAGNLYVNVHSPTFPNGEIRGQIPAPLVVCPPSQGDQPSSSSSSSSSSVSSSSISSSSSSVSSSVSSSSSSLPY